ncbi:MAG: CoxG family protein [Candidatus Geothermarchaeales archaeon]
MRILEFEGTFGVSVSRDRTWEFIMDPAKVSACLPDLESLEVVDDDTFLADFKVGVSYIRGTVKMRVTMTDKISNRHAKLVARGKGIGSTMDIDIVFDLDDKNGETTVSWKAVAQIGGTLAGVASKLLRPASERNIRQLVENIRSNLEKE